MQRNIWNQSEKALGFCDGLKWQCSYNMLLWNSATLEFHHGAGWKGEGQRESYYRDFHRAFEKYITSVEKCRLPAFLFVGLHTAAIKGGQGRINGLLSSCLWDCISLHLHKDSPVFEEMNYPQPLYFLGIAVFSSFSSFVTRRSE